MHIKPLKLQDRPTLEALLAREPLLNVFHISVLIEHGLSEQAYVYEGVRAVGAFRGGDLAGVVVSFRGGGGTYHTPGDEEALRAVARVVVDEALSGNLSLLSGHATQLNPLLTLIGEAGPGRVERCLFRTLQPDELVLPAFAPPEGFSAPRMAHAGDLERLIDFYSTGFYSLAQLPSRAAWRSRLTEQLAWRTLFVIEDGEGKIASAALTSAEGQGAAMLGGVATRHEYRGLGLSTLCVGALCRHLFDMGTKKVGLFYLMGNEPAARVYDRLGFAHAGLWLLVPLGIATLSL
jgi:RimJ/RimL family protein N-acetyltransferase